MPTSTADAGASCWADLPFDLLHDVSHRLHTATEYVSFHTVCKPWRDTIPPASCRPALLPWLLTLPDALGRRTACCVFSSSLAGDRRRWLLRAEHCTAASLLTNSTCVVGDPLARYAGTAPLPPFFSGDDDDELKWRAEPANHAIGTVSSDGTIVVCLFRKLVHQSTYRQIWFNVSLCLLRPGDAAAWTTVPTDLKTSSQEKGLCSVACHDGKIVLCYGKGSWCMDTARSTAVLTLAPGKYGYLFESSYVFESRGELLWAIVEARSHIQSFPTAETAAGLPGVGSRLANDLSVSVYALQEVEPGQWWWVKMDGRSFADRILFLGLPTSFAVDAAQFDMTGGCAYFVIKRSPSGWVGTGTARPCFLFKHSFRDDRSEFIEQLPPEWDHAACMWLTPRPAIAPTNRLVKRGLSLVVKASE
ncbi:hypothetical protein EJB05_29006, partial [Eragrostis curvula]